MGRIGKKWTTKFLEMDVCVYLCVQCIPGIWFISYICELSVIITNRLRIV